MRYAVSASNSAVTGNHAPATINVARVYIYFETLPSGNCYVVWKAGIDDPLKRLGVAFKASDSKLYCATGNLSFGATGVAVTTGQWYRIDCKLNATAGAKTVDAQIDGVALGQATSAEASAPQPSELVALGARGNSVTGEWFYDDILISNTPADYPLGEREPINALYPTADGTHNVAGANQFERGTTGTDITNATTNAFELINEVPLDDTTPDSNDYIAAIAPANAGDYVEVLFGPEAGFEVTSPPGALEVLVATHQADVGSGNTRIALVDNGSTSDVMNQTAAGVTTIRYNRAHFTEPPSAAASWDINGDGGNGDFLNVRMRFYSSDANPDQYWDGAVIEGEFNVAAPTTPGGYYACAGTLPTFDTADQDKIDELKALRAAGQPIGQVFELVKVSWPSPDGDIYYSVIQTDEVASVAPPVSPIETRLIPDGSPDWFLPVQLDATIGDEEVDLAFWDGDGVISDLLVDHGEGIKVELFYWFPEVELLLPVWHGHLRQEDEAEIDVCQIKAVQGFRSSDAKMPRRAHYKECQAIWGGNLATQAEIDEHDCPWNLHLPGGTVGEPGSDLLGPCKRRNRDDCILYLGNNANFMLSHATQTITVANDQTHGPRLYSTSQGNETNLKEAVRVVMGERRLHEMTVLAFARDLNNNDPENGFFRALYEAVEGPIDAFRFPRITVSSVTQDADPFHYSERLGVTGQTPAQTILTEHSYSGTAHFRYTFGWVDPANISPGDASASAVVRGLNNIRIYTDEETYTEEWTDNRAWHIMRMLTDKRWGFGYDYDRLDIPSFIEAACWCANVVQFVDFNGDEFDHIRSLSHLELAERKVQQQIEDVCMAGRLSRPFLFNGKIHIVPLREMTEAELSATPVFTDEGDTPNIIHDEIEDNVFKTTLKRSRISDLDLPNRIECTFDPTDQDNLEQPVRPVEDIDAQLAAGRVVGDHSRKINVKKYPLPGVVVEAQAIKMAWSLLDVGPFDEGGLQNNLELKFKIWFLDALDLFPTKVIKLESSQITRYGFDYFRVKNIKRLGDLHVELTVQAYNEEWYETFETLFGSIDPIPDDPPDPEPPAPDPPTDPLVFDIVTYSGGLLSIFSEATP